jgi:hypothetical protein
LEILKNTGMVWIVIVDSNEEKLKGNGLIWLGFEKNEKPRVNLIQMANLRHTIENKNGIYDKIDPKCIILGTKDLSGISA